MKKRWFFSLRLVCPLFHVSGFLFRHFPGNPLQG